MKDFEFAAGSVMGIDHRHAGRNNQDGYHHVETPEYAVGVVTDGCGSGKYNEAGAHLGARLVVQELQRALKRDPYYLSLDFIQRLVVHKLSTIVDCLGPFPSRSEFINNYWLFTIVGYAITPVHTWIFAFGDGYAVVNGIHIPIGPFENNSPPYLAYGLVDTSIQPELLRFRLLAELPTSSLETFMVGTDGIDFLVHSADLSFPNKADLIGPLSRLWEEDRFYKNSDMVRRHLTLVNGGVKPTASGYLKDDTTLIVGRRREGCYG